MDWLVKLAWTTRVLLVTLAVERNPINQLEVWILRGKGESSSLSPSLSHSVGDRGTESKRGLVLISNGKIEVASLLSIGIVLVGGSVVMTLNNGNCKYKWKERCFTLLSFISRVVTLCGSLLVQSVVKDVVAMYEADSTLIIGRMYVMQ